MAIEAHQLQPQTEAISTEENSPVEALGAIVLAQSQGWRQSARCRGVDPEIFYPERGESTEAPKAICGQCTVRQECLAGALAARDRFGVWGGLSEYERKPLRRQIKQGKLDIQEATQKGIATSSDGRSGRRRSANVST